MTGYGHARQEDEQRIVLAEVKSLNSKYLDISLKLPKTLGDKESEIRNLIGEVLERGKVSVAIEYVAKGKNGLNMAINDALFRKYYTALEQLAEQVGAERTDLFRLALQYPDVVVPLEDQRAADEAWSSIQPVLKEALLQCDGFRRREGKELSDKLGQYLDAIAAALGEVERLDPPRIQRLRDRLRGNLLEVVRQEGLDENRLEQELIYYVEKLDISEEKVRLRSHLDHFREALLHPGASMGRKMQFIAQELGREINTIGSKSNDAGLQRLVVGMKEELEKIKEQVLNLL